jgi:uncharacterized membrane protein YphA (DoxX/SURF4 family)
MIGRPMPLRALSIALGIFFLAMCLNKIAWIGDSRVLTDRFDRWLPDAAPYAQWYLRDVVIPAGPVWARLVPLGEFCTAMALLLGIRVRLASLIAFLMVLNFHLATSAFSSWAFLRDGTGPPVLGALLALALAKEPLPFSVRWPSGRPAERRGHDAGVLHDDPVLDVHAAASRNPAIGRHAK